MNSYAKKNEKLGMNVSTAYNQLRKITLFDLAKKLQLHICFRCGEEICKIEEFSIEHKIPWINSEDPKKLFWSLDNIAFSHLTCNSKAGNDKKKKKEHPAWSLYRDGCRCEACKALILESSRRNRARKLQKDNK